MNKISLRDSNKGLITFSPASVKSKGQSKLTLKLLPFVSKITVSISVIESFIVLFISFLQLSFKS